MLPKVKSTWVSGLSGYAHTSIKTCIQIQPKTEQKFGHNHILKFLVNAFTAGKN